MSEKGLCWKCKLQIGFDAQMEISRPYLHCHHEPEEKPKCWCNGMREPQILKMIAYDLEIIFCPQCGRKL